MYEPDKGVQWDKKKQSSEVSLGVMVMMMMMVAGGRDECSMKSVRNSRRQFYRSNLLQRGRRRIQHEKLGSAGAFIVHENEQKSIVLCRISMIGST